MQWYENNPTLLEAEKFAMNKHFPKFNFEIMDDGRASWIGTIISSELHKEYHVLVVYDNNHPHNYFEDYSSVKIYPIFPDADEMFDTVAESDRRGWLLHDECDNNFMRLITKREDIDNQSTVQTAASFLLKATAWVDNYERMSNVNSKKTL